MPVTRTTPVRDLDAEDRDGCRILSEPPQTWVDGGEERIAAILEQADDLTSLSDELAAHDDDWVSRYHLSRERGNIVRPLALDPDARVLEIGAGCGAVTRTLGETVALVDALEPTLSRARCARLRTRDLASVQVFVGELDDVPRVPAYDAIVAVGVLEYVGGAGGAEERVSFLREAAARLRPGGCLVLAIENQLGVKYFAGAPEDHQDQPFEGLEDYPRRGPFRTFSRVDLEALVEAAGMKADVLQAFPDYKLPRLLLSDALLAGPAASIAWRAARFPSYDSPSPRPRLASEFHLWRALVRAGLGRHFGNSFLVICRPPGGESLWPDELQAAFYTSNRRAPFGTESRVLTADGGIVFARRHLSPGDDPRREGALEHRCGTMPFEPGPTVLDRLEHADDTELAELLGRWRRHVLATPGSADGRNIDPLPDNIIDTPSGWRAVDDEWLCADWTPEAVLSRCLLYLALSITDRRPPERWPEGCDTIEDLVFHLAALAGADDAAADLDRVLAHEAEVQAQVNRTAPGADGWETIVSEEHDRLRAVLKGPLELTALGLREWEIRDAQDSRVADLSAKVEEFHALLVERQALLDEVRETAATLRTDVEGREAAIALSERELDERQRRIAALQDELDRVRAAHAVVVSSRTWRLAASLRGLAATLRRRS